MYCCMEFIFCSNFLNEKRNKIYSWLFKKQKAKTSYTCKLHLNSYEYDLTLPGQARKNMIKESGRVNPHEAPHCGVMSHQAEAYKGRKWTWKEVLVRMMDIFNSPSLPIASWWFWKTIILYIKDSSCQYLLVQESLDFTQSCRRETRSKGEREGGKEREREREWERFLVTSMLSHGLKKKKE